MPCHHNAYLDECVYYCSKPTSRPDLFVTCIGSGVLRLCRDLRSGEVRDMLHRRLTFQTMMRLIRVMSLDRLRQIIAQSPNGISQQGGFIVELFTQGTIRSFNTTVILYCSLLGGNTIRGIFNDSHACPTSSSKKRLALKLP